MEKALNGQINAELYASYLYLSMSCASEAKNLPGFAKWFRVQAQEEVLHAMRIFDYVLERGGQVELDEIQKPPKSWKSIEDAMQAAYDHEVKVTSMIGQLLETAQELKDHATQSMLKWFVDEQVEEEATADEVLNKIRMIGDAKGAMYMLDREMGQRAPIFPDPVSGE